MAVTEGSPAEYATWLLLLVGVWAIAAPFVYAEDVSGAALNNYIGTGVVVILLAGFVAYSIRADGQIA